MTSAALGRIFAGYFLIVSRPKIDGQAAGVEMMYFVDILIIRIPTRGLGENLRSRRHRRLEVELLLEQTDRTLVAEGATCSIVACLSEEI